MRVGIAVSCSLSLALAATSAAGQITVHSAFDGIQGPGNGFVSNPDTNGGVGPNHVAEVTNGKFDVFDKTTGTAVTGAATTLNAFWTAAGVTSAPPLNAYDPRIFYDPLSSRWFASSMKGSQSAVFIGISVGTDPSKAWRSVTVPVAGLDNDKIATDKNGVYLCGLSGSTTYNQCWAIPKADLVANPPTLAHLVPLGSVGSLLGVYPASDFNPNKSASAAAWVVNRNASASETQIDLYAIQWSGGAAKLTPSGSIGLGTLYPIKPTTAGVQPNGGLGLQYGESRLANVIEAAGSLWTIAETEVMGRDGVFWAEIDVSGPTPTLVQQGVLGDPNYDLLYPSIGVNDSGDVGIGVIRSSAMEYPSVYVTGRRASDPKGTLRPLVLGKAGSADYTCNGKAQLGDYSITWPDPTAPSVFWSVDAYAPSASACAFGTAWISYDLGGETGTSTSSSSAAGGGGGSAASSSSATGSGAGGSPSTVGPGGASTTGGGAAETPATDGGSTDTGGCGCRVAPTANERPWFATFALLGVALAYERRSARRSRERRGESRRHRLG